MNSKSESVATSLAIAISEVPILAVPSFRLLFLSNREPVLDDSDFHTGPEVSPFVAPRLTIGRWVWTNEISDRTRAK